MPVTQAPYDKAGNLIRYTEVYPYRGDRNEPITWRPNTPFAATLTIDGHQTGAHASYVQWTDAEGRTYPMFMRHLVQLMRQAAVHDGAVQGHWIIAKNGGAFGIRLATEAELRAASAP